MTILDYDDVAGMVCIKDTQITTAYTTEEGIKCRPNGEWVPRGHGIEISMWWPVLGGKVTRAYAENGLSLQFGRELARASTLNYTYEYGYRVGEVNRPRMLFKMSQDGKTETDGRTLAVRVEERPILCPKVRKGIETRWYSSAGQWQKYTKKEGWVPA